MQGPAALIRGRREARGVARSCGAPHIASRSMKSDATKANATLTALAASTIPNTRQVRGARNGQTSGQNSTTAFTSTASSQAAVHEPGLNVRTNCPPVSSQARPDSGIRMIPSPAESALTTTAASAALRQENFS